MNLITVCQTTHTTHNSKDIVIDSKYSKSHNAVVRIWGGECGVTVSGIHTTINF